MNGPDAPDASKPAGTRTHSIDNLRTFLNILVILHHSALAFSRVGTWPYMSPFPSSAFSNAAITLFALLNQTFFMGLLFFLAGHFSAISVERKTYRAFCVDKLKRLGIPTVGYTLILHPMMLLLADWARNESLWGTLTSYYAQLDGVSGTVWFTATLLAFDLTYATTRLFLPTSFTHLIPTTQAQYHTATVLGFSITTIVTFLVRLAYPTGRTMPPLSLQLGYAPQYVLAYIAGAGTSTPTTRQWILTPNPNLHRALVRAYAGATFTLLLAFTTLGPWTLAEGGYHGGWSPAALFYAIWNDACFYFLGRAWYSYFLASPHTKRKWGDKLQARASYGAFLVHSVVVVALQILVDRAAGAMLDGVFKAVIVGGLAVFGSWAVASRLIRIRWVGSVI
uniref:Acyltransferase 3 n=1 Tax=Mycena chlorophos TaxID=658473 RepID=A0ABQ0LDV6_MYCCL|nr:acyltransferase 3 [Mycena chlorophos]